MLFLYHGRIKTGGALIIVRDSNCLEESGCEQRSAQILVAAKGVNDNLKYVGAAQHQSEKEK
jgi:hypothetical protein